MAKCWWGYTISQILHVYTSCTTHMMYWHTLSCMSTSAPAFTSSTTTSVLPFMAAHISAESPHCVMTDMCSMIHTHTNIHCTLTSLTLGLSVCLSVYLSVCLCVCLLSHISRLECLFVLKSMSCTQWATKVKICGVFFETAPLQRSTTSCIVRLSVRSAIFTPLKILLCIIQLRIVLSYLCVLSAARVASYHSYIQSCSASDSSKDKEDTPPATKLSMCESLCSPIMSFCTKGSALQCFHWILQSVSTAPPHITATHTDTCLLHIQYVHIKLLQRSWCNIQ